MIEPAHADRAEWTNPGELAGAGAAIALAVSMFALKWFGVVAPPGSARRAGASTAENAWNGLSVLRWLMLLAVIFAVGSLVLHANQRAHGTQTETALAVLVVGTVTALLLCYRVLLDPPHPSYVVDIKLGAVLGLLSAVGIAVGGLESLRVERAGKRVAEHRARTRPEGLPSSSHAR